LTVVRALNRGADQVAKLVDAARGHGQADGISIDFSGCRLASFENEHTRPLGTSSFEKRAD
jgi:hypothetical protein